MIGYPLAQLARDELELTLETAARRPATFRPARPLRHRRVTTWLAAGKPTALVQKAMGHRSITVTEKYLHLVPTNLRALVVEERS